MAVTFAEVGSSVLLFFLVFGMSATGAKLCFSYHEYSFSVHFLYYLDGNVMKKVNKIQVPCV